MPEFMIRMKRNYSRMPLVLCESQRGRKFSIHIASSVNSGLYKPYRLSASTEKEARQKALALLGKRNYYITPVML